MATPGDPARAGVALAEARVARGNIYLAREICDRVLAGIESVALVRRDAAVSIVPLQRGSAGGLLLKVRNARGDRVIHAQEFLRSNGFVDDAVDRVVAARWDPQSASLVLTDLARAPRG